MIKDQNSESIFARKFILRYIMICAETYTYSGFLSYFIYKKFQDLF